MQWILQPPPQFPLKFLGGWFFYSETRDSALSRVPLSTFAYSCVLMSISSGFLSAVPSSPLSSVPSFLATPTIFLAPVNWPCYYCLDLTSRPLHGDWGSRLSPLVSLPPVQSLRSLLGPHWPDLVSSRKSYFPKRVLELLKNHRPLSQSLPISLSNFSPFSPSQGQYIKVLPWDMLK